MATRLKSKKTTQQLEKRDEEVESESSSEHANDANNALTMLTANDGGQTEEPAGASLDLILRELRGFRQDSKVQLESIKGELAKVNSRMDAAETRILQSEERIQVAEDVLAEMLKLQSRLQDRLTDQESRSRRENVRIYGVVEGAEVGTDSVSTFVEKLLRENLEIPQSTNIQIERAHRALGPRPPSGAPPRSIVVRFLSYKTKEDILRMAWQKRGFEWRNNKITLDHDYASGILLKRREYAEARRVLKENNIKFRSLYPAKLRVFYDEGMTTYESVQEATRDMADRGLPVTVLSHPDTLLDQIRCMTWQPSRARTGRDSRDRGVSGFKEKLSAFRR